MQAGYVDQAGDATAAPRIAGQPALTSEQRGQLARAIGRSRVVIENQDEAWRPAIERIDPAAVPDERPACAELRHERDRMRSSPQAWNGTRLFELPLSRFKGGSSASLSSAPFALDMVRREQRLPRESPTARSADRALDELDDGLERPSHLTYEERLARATIEELRGTDVLLVLDEVREPTGEVRGGRGFEPGTIVARAWVYDHARDAVVCAGVVRVTSSPSIDTGVSNLNDDLLTNLVRAIPDQVRQLAPP